MSNKLLDVQVTHHSSRLFTL